MDDRYEDFAPLELKLLRGPIYHEDSSWDDLFVFRTGISRHLGKIGLVLHIDEEDGFAYVGQMDNDGEGEELPRLVHRRPLNSDVTLLCVLLREEWEKARVSLEGSGKCYLSSTDLFEALDLFYPEISDESTKDYRFNSMIQKVKDLGLIRERGKGGSGEERIFEVLPIIKALVNPEFVKEFKTALESMNGENDNA
ncbi:MAG: hypothetical protein DRP60_15650 [Spirochaetes bacterium]|nr:MAG: hypothetical protein DRP60_15650 [Spirochaetota bacterium]